MDTTFIRWKQDEERRTPIDRFSALPDDHPFVHSICAACGEPLKAGDIPTLFAVGPITPSDALKHDGDRWYSALAVVMHERCAWAT